MAENYVFKLYVVGSTPASQKAEASLKKALKIAGIEYSLETVDVLENPDVAVENGIVATPTLVKESPAPTKKIIGNFGNAEKVLSDLEIKAESK